MSKNLTKAEFLANPVYTLLVEELLSLIEDREIATRLKTFFGKDRIKFVGELVLYSERYINMTPGMGSQRMYLLKEAMQKVGIDFNTLILDEKIDRDVLRTDLEKLRADREEKFSLLQKLFLTSTDLSKREWARLARQVLTRRDIDSLPGWQGRILEARLLQKKPMPFKELGNRYGVSGDAIKKLETKGLLTIQRNVRAAMVATLLPN